jgi:MFS family permease
MNQQLFTKPFYIFFLVLPYGISIGFVTVTMPYVLTNKGFSVAEVAGIVSLGLSANIWRFFWGPLADLTLSLKRWYWIGVTACVLSLMLLCFIPFKIQNITLITGVVFLSQVAATFVVLPVGGIKEKLLAAKRAGIKEVIMCSRNRKDVDEIPESYLTGLTIHYVDHASEVLSIALLGEMVNHPIDLAWRGDGFGQGVVATA